MVLNFWIFGFLVFFSQILQKVLFLYKECVLLYVVSANVTALHTHREKHTNTPTIRFFLQFSLFGMQGVALTCKVPLDLITNEA